MIVNKLTNLNRVSRRQVAIGLGCALTGAAAQALVPRQKRDLLGTAKLETLVPSTIGDWSYLQQSGLVLPPSDQLSDRLYDQLLTRVYVSESALPIMLLMAQSPVQDGTLQVHRPEVCYPASGYRLSQSEVHQLNVLPGKTVATRIFTAQGGDRIEQLLYWTRVGEELPTTWLDQRLAVARANIRGQVPDGLIVRISTIAPDRSAVSTLDRFAKELVLAVAPPGRPALVGTLLSSDGASQKDG
jgi:EpsI family protein